MSSLVGNITGVPEIVLAFLRLDVVENLSDGAPEGFPCSCGGIPQIVLDLRERLLDRVQVRAVRRQEERVRLGGPDRPENLRALVAGQVVHHHHVALLQRRNQLLRHPGQENIPVDRTFEHPGGVDPVVAQRGDESGRVPVAERGRSEQALPLRPPAPERRHVRLHAGFVYESKAFHVNPPLMAPPALTAALHIGAVTLVGDAGHLLEAEPAAFQEPPDRISADRKVEGLVHAARQFPDRDPGALPHLFPDPAFVRGEGGRDVAADFCRGRRPGLPEAAEPLRGGGRGDVESGGNGAAGFAAPHGCDDAQTKVVGIGFGHCSGSPGCDARIESGFGACGNP